MDVIYGCFQIFLALVYAIIKHIPEKWDYEIIVVDDNSPDKTYDLIVNEFQQNDRVKAVLRTADRGLSKSIRAGIEQAAGDQLLVMDTDFTHNPADIPTMLHLAIPYEFVSGSRFCPGGSMEDFSHYLASLLFNLLIRITLTTQIQDSLSGFYTVRKDKLAALDFDRIFFGYGDYYFRLLYYAQRSGLSIIEIPTNYRERDQGRSKSNYPLLLLSYLWQLIRLRFKSLF